MFPSRLSARPQKTPVQPTRPPGEVFRRFFDLIERMERPRRPEHPPAPETKARISRLDYAPRRHA